MLRAYTAAAVRAAEEPLVAAGAPDALMREAAFALGTAVLGELRGRGARVPGSVVLLLVGGGANGGDALYAGVRLAARGALVHAALCSEQVHAPALAAARRAGVRVHEVAAAGGLDVGALLDLARRSGVWVDGLAGTGTRGALREPLAGAVRALTDELAGSPDEPVVVAVDVPSGIGVDDGALPGAVLPATLTVTMGAPKPGLLLPPAAASAGRLALVDLGLEAGLGAGEPAVCRLTSADVGDLWPVPVASDHKYTRGVLGLLAGSATYPGAAVLAAGGALGAGLGMVRYLGPREVTTLIHARHPEVVPGEGRVQAWAIGSGLDPQDGARADEARAAVSAAATDQAPAVLDAGALALLPERLWPGAVLTPHAGELATLLGTRGHDVTRAEVEAEPLRHSRLAAGLTGATVLLKGELTVVAGPSGPAYAQDAGPSWLATAGSGDVLTGVLGALLAGCADEVAADGPGGDLPARLAAAAALVHGRAGDLAARGAPTTASGVAAAVPDVLREILAGTG
ncbi:bifunctional ADP-dependent NAD(P)H-hydrate dehydratase/NAD(P)H-hydrate epimerase [Georgenia wangjunii]|uniref:bifunctional ADP-dependent NAD(P)H-hydrate dehydratase/NAD(P)H-hydrate epimerase n=1 Tax=Georgenia wangjunii TaxID=3117730 RepID=UPI002F263352